MTAKEIAQKYAGQVVKCSLNKSPPIDDGAGHYIKTFDARIIGWKNAIGSDPEFVAVEVLPPGKTKYLIAHFIKGYHFTTAVNKGGYAKKLLANEIILPSIGNSSPKYISQWPHKCRDCGSPAQILLNAIDCSNEKCHHKYKTSSGSDLFVPKNMKPELSKSKTGK